MKIFTLLRTAAIAAVIAVTGASAATAQGYPNRPIKIICGYAAGGGADTLIRYYARQLETLIKSPVVVENRVGAQGNVGTHTALAAPNDGYTLLILGTTAVVGNMFLLKDIKYDPLTDFEHVATIFQNGYVLTVAPKDNIASVEQLIAQLKKKEGKARYGSNSGGTLVAAEQLLTMTGTKAERVNYKSTADLLPDLAAGDLDFAFLDTPFAIAQAKQGRVKMLAVSPKERQAAIPDMPTIAEAGVAGYEFGVVSPAWFPKGTPKEIVNQMNKWMVEIAKMPETTAFLAANGAYVNTTTPEQTTALVRSEIERWGKATAAAGVQKE